MASATNLTYRVRNIPAGIDVNEPRLPVPVFLRASLSLAQAGQTVHQITVRSLAPSLDDVAGGSTQLATVEFETLPTCLSEQDRSEWSIKSLTVTEDLLFDTHFLGFTPLNMVKKDDYRFDCISITGLAGHPFGSWRQRRTGTASSHFMWLRDQLPKDVPGLRVLTYGYDTQLMDSTSTQNIWSLARSFLTQLQDIRPDEPSAKPLIILAHSLGGILLKQALIQLHEGTDTEKLILKKIKMIVMFGVPNRGMQVEHVQTMTYQQPNAALVASLGVGSDYLRLLDGQFSTIARSNNIRIVSAYETKESATVELHSSGKWRRTGRKELLLSHDSATQQASHPSDVFHIDQDHSDIVKFAPGDPNYLIVRRFVQNAMSDRQVFCYDQSTSRNGRSSSIELPEHVMTTPSSDSLSRQQIDQSSPGFSIQEITISDVQDSLSVPDENPRLQSIDVATNTTFSWIFEKDELHFMNWIKGGSGIYWIRGKAGSGKSTLVKFLYDHRQFRDSLAITVPYKRIDVWFFFNDGGSELQKDTRGLLMSLLSQLTAKDKRIAQLVFSEYSSRYSGKKSVWTTEDLAETFSAILAQSSFDIQLIVFLDALDEYDGFSKTIADWVSFLVKPTNFPRSRTRVKVCLSSRPWDVFTEEFKFSSGFNLQEHTFQDMVRHIKSTPIDNPSPQNSAREVTQSLLRSQPRLVHRLATKAEGVFLWLRFAMDEIARVLPSNAHDLEILIRGLPVKLEDFYRSTLGRIPQHHREEAFKIIEIVSRSRGLLLPADLIAASKCCDKRTFKAYEDALEELRRNSLPNNTAHRELLNLCGGLLEIWGEGEDARIQFIHKSVKDYATRPEFSHEFFGQDQAPHSENGFTWLFKFKMVNAKWSRFPTFSNVRDLLFYARQAGSTLSDSSCRFIDSIPQRQLDFVFGEIFTPPGNKSTFGQRCTKHATHVGFAVLAGLRQYLDYLFRDNTRLRKAQAQYNPLYGIAQYSRRMSSVEAVLGDDAHASLAKMFEVLLDAGFRPADTETGVTCWDALCSPLPENSHPVQLRKTSLRVLLATILLQDSRQDINAWIKTNAEGSLDFLSETSWFLKWNARSGDDEKTHFKERARAMHLSIEADMTNLLLQHGADPNAVDKQGRTVLDFYMLKLISKNEYSQFGDGRQFYFQVIRMIPMVVDKGGHITHHGDKIMKKFLGAVKNFGGENLALARELRELPRKPRQSWTVVMPTLFRRI